MHVMFGADARHMAPVGKSKVAKFLWVFQFSQSHITISLFQLCFDRTVLDNFYIIQSGRAQDVSIGWIRGGPLFFHYDFHLT